MIDGAFDMTMRLLALLLFSCLAAFGARAAALDLDGSGWSILDSPNCPESPSTVAVNGKPAWRLEVEGTCEPRYVVRDTDDAVRAAIKRPGAALVVKLHVANAQLRSSEDGGKTAYATVMLQRKGDSPSGRQWASSNRIALVNGSATVTIPLDRATWTGSDGKSASDTDWNDLLANLDKLGIALGGESDQAGGIKGHGGLFMIEFRID